MLREHGEPPKNRTGTLDMLDPWGTAVLVADAHPGDARRVSQLLEGGRADALHVTHAATLEAARSLLRSQDFNVVLLGADLGPGAVEALGAIRAESAGTPVLVLGDQSLGQSVAAARAGAFDCLPKDGLTAAALRRALRSAVEHGRAVGPTSSVPSTDEPFEPGRLSTRDVVERTDEVLARMELRFRPRRALASGAVVAAELALSADLPGRGPVGEARLRRALLGARALDARSSWLIRTVARAAARWPFGGRLVMNVLDEAMLDPEGARNLLDGAEGWGLPPDRLQVELTEAQLSRATRSLPVLQDRGVRVGLRGLGGPEASVAAAANHAVDVVRLDAALVGRMDASPRHRAVVQGLLDLGRALGAVTVADGVATEAQLSALADSGCDHAQGPAVAAPVGAEEAASQLGWG